MVERLKKRLPRNLTGRANRGEDGELGEVDGLGALPRIGDSGGVEVRVEAALASGAVGGVEQTRELAGAGFAFPD